MSQNITIKLIKLHQYTILLELLQQFHKKSTHDFLNYVIHPLVVNEIIYFLGTDVAEDERHTVYRTRRYLGFVLQCRMCVAGNTIIKFYKVCC